jgi:hypothetical protein
MAAGSGAAADWEELVRRMFLPGTTMAPSRLQTPPLARSSPSAAPRARRRARPLRH